MLRFVTIAAVIALAAGSASAQTLDKNGKCHGPDGRFASIEVCKGATAAAPGAGPYKLDAKGNCHDAKGRMAKKTMCAAAKK